MKKKIFKKERKEEGEKICYEKNFSIGNNNRGLHPLLLLKLKSDNRGNKDIHEEGKMITIPDTDLGEKVVEIKLIQVQKDEEDD